MPPEIGFLQNLRDVPNEVSHLNFATLQPEIGMLQNLRDVQNEVTHLNLQHLIHSRLGGIIETGHGRSERLPLLSHEDLQRLNILSNRRHQESLIC